MFASQLLRILQTIPSDMKHETCVLDSTVQNMNMKENQDLTFCDSKNFGKDADPLAFGGEGICQLNGSGRGIAFEVNGRDEHWSSKIVADIADDNESGTIDSSRKEDPNEPLLLRGQERDAESLPSETQDEEKLQRSPVLESTSVDKIVHRRENESSDLGSLLISTSDLFETDTDLYTDKNVLEFEMPELIVCYKEINYHVVKDICVDEGMPENDKIVIESSKYDRSGVSLVQPRRVNYHCDDTEVVTNNEFVTSDGLAEPSLENTKSIGENDSGSIEVGDDKTLAQSRPRLPSESSFENDNAKHCDLERSMQTGDANCDATGKTVTDVSEKESFIDSKLPIQEFGTRSFLRSFLNTLDGEGNKNVQPFDQIISGTEPKEDKQTTNILYNSKVESGSITFNFNYPAPAVSNITNGGVENAKDESSESKNVHDHLDENVGNRSDCSSVQCTGIKDSSAGDVHEPSLDIKKSESDNSSDTGQVQFASNTGMRNKTSDIESFDREDSNSNDLSASGEVQLTSSKGQSSKKDDAQAVEQHAHKNSDETSVVSPLQYDEGDSSFSAAGLITFSGPIAYTGSLSLRSDGSATSGRSFAFPILQSEWNSSPVRMAKAERRHFRKHKGWRSGLLCCRF